MAVTRAKRRKPGLGKVLLVALLIFFFAGLVITAIELVRPGLVRGKLYTAYFVAKAATWEREYPSGMPDTRPVDRVVTALLAPEIAKMPAKTWRMVDPEPFEETSLNALNSPYPFGIEHVQLSPLAAEWRYLDDGSDPGAGWHTLAYDDSTWKTGAAPLVFAGEKISTQLVESGAQAFYFRREFIVEDLSIYRLLDVELLGGDGAVVYLNGTEIFRRNLLAGEISDRALTLEVDRPRPENTYYLQTTDSASLQPGRNVLAVELHQANPARSESRFDLILHGALLPASVRFAVIGDFGSGGKDAKAVADLVKRWDPDLIITTGDNNYAAGEARTIDKNVGQFYHDYIAPYYGRYGPGADRNRFFPTMGNHDWSDNNDIPSPPNAYLNYFTLPPGQGNERYYDFSWGPVHFFALDSDINEPDGMTSTSIQARWLQARLEESQAPWKLVYQHHPPFSSSDTHPPTAEMNWPFAEWGASLVMSGHNHFYERIEQNGIPYIINGVGGGELYGFGEPAAGSQVRFTGDYGAMLVQANPCNLQFWFITVDNAVIDTAQLVNDAPACRSDDLP